MTKLKSVAVVAALLGLSGCASQKEPAEHALAATEAKFEESGAEIQKYLPDRHAELTKSIDALRAAMANQDFGDVVSGAASVQDAIKRAIADSRVKRATMRIEMEAEWDALVKSMPEMIAAMDKKIAAHRRRPPEGIAKDAWKATIESYDAARDAWTKAEADMAASSANFETAVPSAREAKAKIAQIMESVGLKVS